MLPNSRIFRSRWTAVLWAGGMLWLAIDVAGVGGSPKHAGATTNDATGVPADDGDTRNALNAFDSVG